MSQALLRALRSIKGDVTIARACLQDSVETHGSHGGWLDEERARLERAEDELDSLIAALAAQEAHPARPQHVIDHEPGGIFHVPSALAEWQAGEAQPAAAPWLGSIPAEESDEEFIRQVEAMDAQPAAAQEPLERDEEELDGLLHRLLDDAEKEWEAQIVSYPDAMTLFGRKVWFTAITETQRSSSGARSDEPKSTDQFLRDAATRGAKLIAKGVEVQGAAQEQQDAARYRWLRDACSMDNWREVCDFSPDDLDAHIDRALTQSRREE